MSTWLWNTVMAEILPTISKVLLTYITLSCKYRVKTGNFGHQVNSDIHLQTVKILMRRLLMSRLIRIFTVC